VLRFPGPSTPLEVTVDLVARVQRGDDAALEILIKRYFVPLRRLGHNRLPRLARPMTDTDDLVQDALVNTIRQLPHFVCRNPGALLAYLRRAVLNRIIDERRRCLKLVDSRSEPDDLATQAPSQLQSVLNKEEIVRYRAALRRLRPRDRQLIIMRVEQQLTYREIGTQLGMPSANAARIASARATARFATALKHV
jgi:RNA polymerase sigma factor (sigma-70 family)